MSKRNRLKKNVEAAAVAEKVPVSLSVGSHAFPAFDGLAAAFGAGPGAYPRKEDIPGQFRSHSGPYQDVVSALFFRGGKLADYGLSIKPSIDKVAAMTAIRALMSSFAPKHELKTATVAWALSEWCDGKPTAA